MAERTIVKFASIEGMPVTIPTISPFADSNQLDISVGIPPSLVRALEGIISELKYSGFYIHDHSFTVVSEDDAKPVPNKGAFIKLVVVGRDESTIDGITEH